MQPLDSRTGKKSEPLALRIATSTAVVDTKAGADEKSSHREKSLASMSGHGRKSARSLLSGAFQIWSPCKHVYLANSKNRPLLGRHRTPTLDVLEHVSMRSMCVALSTISDCYRVEALSFR